MSRGQRGTLHWLLPQVIYTAGHGGLAHDGLTGGCRHLPYEASRREAVFGACKPVDHTKLREIEWTRGQEHRDRLRDVKNVMLNKTTI